MTFFKQTGRLLVGLLWIMIPGRIQGQATPLDTSFYLVLVSPPDRPILESVLRPQERKRLNDSVFQVRNLPALLSILQQKGYAGASFDTLPGKSAANSVRFVPGPRMNWLRFYTADPVSERWFRTSGMADRFQSGKTLSTAQVWRLQQKILENAENNGYPFARIWLDSIRIDSAGAAAAQLRVLPGRYFTWQAIEVNGAVKIPAATLARYIGIRPGTPYNRAAILRIRQQLQALPYLESYAPPNVRFAGDKATVQLYLKKKRAGRFDFIIGLLPQPENGANPANNLILTGSLNGLLLNAFGLGERMAIEMERLRPETQKLDIQTAVPYIAGSPFGAEGRMYIFRRDSAWVDAQGHVGVQFLLSGNDRVVFFGENRSSSLQKVDTLALANTRSLPANLDYRQNGLGVETEWTRLDYRFNPRRGWYAQSKVFAGTHTIRRNPQIEQIRLSDEPDFQFSSLYDSLNLRATRIRLEAKTECYVPLGKNGTFLIRLRGGGIFSSETVTQNEQYRLGGNKLLRGFDEESLFATRWALATAEFRLILSQNAYMAVFADGAYLENVTARTRLFQRPVGLGAGMNFETQAGIFGISAAVGRPDGGGFDFRATKIHIGYVSAF